VTTCCAHDALQMAAGAACNHKEWLLTTSSWARTTKWAWREALRCTERYTTYPPPSSKPQQHTAKMTQPPARHPESPLATSSEQMNPRLTGQ
jgi:hypothetical protein